MDYHKNAPWTAVSRERLARMVVNEGFSLRAAAARFSVSAKTAAKWVGRYRQKDPMVASITSRPSAAPRSEQPLDHLQAPGKRFRSQCADRIPVRCDWHH